MTALPGHIVITGGGTAGWLSALMLRDLARRRHHDLRLTVIESSKIGTIGVGEGTTAVFRQMLMALGLDEMDFLRETGATIKYGIRHRDWRRLGHYYDGPIDDTAAVAGKGLDTYAVAAGKPITDVHLFTHLMAKGRAPWAERSGRRVAAGPYHHAYHFDQAKAGAFLKRHAKGVEVIDDQVLGVESDAGAISALVLESGQRVEADFFVDCSGFSRRVIRSLGAEWISYGDVLPVNRAMPFWIDLRPGEEIAPLTHAWAQGAGWMWQIPTQGRIGCGYVYSDAHTSPDQAKAEIEAALGHEIEPRRDIKIDAGRLRDAWTGNCVALGLASSFLEPLEATSIHGTIVQLMLLCELLDKPGGAEPYNAAVGRQVDDFRDFIRLHYVSERRDTPFWRDVADSHPAEVTYRLAAWAGRIPERADFTPFPMGLPHVEEQLYTPVLDGLGLLSRDAAKAQMAANPKARATLRKTHEALTREYRKAALQCLPHRAFLSSLQEDVTA
ncbi:tryptophan halogenase family protein [Flavimaricola marinus]|uniref:Flavin-dependent tryptophan halogenase RebH n=1 Tax=Flavimaricola marinus TaxID=1819565 RepID=A0A238LB93_9RHOB|nr:tryptophan halogenase family protein [Flavimaricola marinus]SMY06674.1 Flavin-dependent tryptophan halogenase RebH [Flavimaricola marinus]